MVLKIVFQINTRCYKVIGSVIRMLNKPLWREVETIGLYWFAQPELCPILLYSLVKGSINQNLITKQIF